MSRLTRDKTAEPVSRDQILRHARGQGNINFPCSADHEQDWQPYRLIHTLLYVMTIQHTYTAICDDHTYIHTYPYIFMFTQASNLVWFDGTIIDISTILVAMYYSGYIGL